MDEKEQLKLVVEVYAKSTRDCIMKNPNLTDVEKAQLTAFARDLFVRYMNEFLDGACDA